MSIDELKGIEVDIEDIKYIINKYKSGQNIIVVTGEFSSGKSSFINCLVNRRDFLPHGKTECTPILIDISEGNEGIIEVRKCDGTVFEVENNVENIVTYAKYDEEADNDILSITVPLLNSGLPEGIHLIDTPGTNTVLKEHEKITKFMIKRADAVLYLFNKVVSKSDINHIKSILEYTTNIIFIMTHTDEIDTKTGKKYTKQRIEELVAEAKKEISAGLVIDIDDLIVCNIGLMDGFENREEIDEINHLLVSYVETQTQERRMRVARKRIEKILQDALNNYVIKRDLLIKRQELDEEAITVRINKFKKDQVKYEKEYNNLIEIINQRLVQQEDYCKSELSRLLSEERESICALLLKENVDEKAIEDKIGHLNNQISEKMRKNIEEAISIISHEAYASVNENLNELNKDFDIASPIVLSVPDVKEYDDSRIAARVIAVERQIEENLRELEKLKENSSEEEIRELEKQIQLCEVQKQSIDDKFIQLGSYKPEFITVENEGGFNAGRITGRVIGEVADMALLLWNPAGAAGEVAKATSEATKVINAADKAKDAATIFRYIKTAAGKAAETENEVNKKKEQMKRVATTIKKVDEGRREIIECVQENSREIEQDGVTLSTMLDMLSIGHWTEKIGGAIGEIIKPTSSISIEDAEVKAAYEARKQEITEESSKLSNEIYILKERLCEIDDFGKTNRIKNELREKNRALEEKKKELEELKKRKAMKYSDEQIKAQLRCQIEEYEKLQQEKGIRLIQAILCKAKYQIIERITADYYEKLDYFQDLISELSSQTLDSEAELSDCENIVNILSSSLSDVRVWLE